MLCIRFRCTGLTAMCPSLARQPMTSTRSALMTSHSRSSYEVWTRWSEPARCVSIPLLLVFRNSLIPLVYDAHKFVEMLGIYACCCTAAFLASNPSCTNKPCSGKDCAVSRLVNEMTAHAGCRLVPTNVTYAGSKRNITKTNQRNEQAHALLSLIAVPHAELQMCC